MHQNLAVLLWLLCYGKISFIVLVPVQDHFRCHLTMIHFRFRDLAIFQGFETLEENFLSTRPALEVCPAP